MADQSRYEKLVNAAKKNVTEICPTDAAAAVKSGAAILIDVRETNEWEEGHIPDAIHLSRGTLELEIEEKAPNPNATVIVHCAGGGRAALAAESLQKMGYKNVRSMAGGFKAWKTLGMPTIK